jgi:transcription initiation factor TFIIF subunit alpha
VCENSSELYGNACKHMTLCLSCGKCMSVDRRRCHLCAAPITKLIREYNVRAANACTDKTFFFGRFVSGTRPFSRKRSADIKWSLHKDGLQGRQLTDAQKDKLKNKPWILEDETGQHQFQGPLEGSNSHTATYYLLMLQGREFQAYPAGSWCFLLPSPYGPLIHLYFSFC